MADTDSVPTVPAETLEQDPTGTWTEAPSEYGTLPEVAKTFGENVLSGATLGGSEIAEQAAFQNAVQRQARSQENPLTAMAGQALGFGGAQLIPGYGEALDVLGVPGEAAAKALGAGKIGTAALEGASKWAGIGAAQSVAHEAALGDPDLNASKLLSAAGTGGLIGGGLGLLGGVLPPALSSAAGALESATKAASNFLPKGILEGGMPAAAGAIAGDAIGGHVGSAIGAFLPSILKKILPPVGEALQGDLDATGENFVNEIKNEMYEKYGFDASNVQPPSGLNPENPGVLEKMWDNVQKLNAETEKMRSAAPLAYSGIGALTPKDSTKPITMDNVKAALVDNIQKEFRNPLELAKGLMTPITTATSLLYGTAHDLGFGLNENILGTVKNMLGESGEKIAQAAKSVFGEGLGAAVDAGAYSLASYTKNAKHIQELTNDPNAMVQMTQKATYPLGQVAPKLASQIETQLAQGINFLNTKIPKPLNPQILDPEWEPSQQQKITFNDYYKAVDDPISTLKQIKNGGLTNASMETLQTVYPGLLMHMRAEVMSNMDVAKASKMPFASQIALAKFLGQPLSVGMTPQAIQGNQLALASQPAPQPPQAKKGRGSSAKHLEMADRASTRTSQEEAES